MTKPTYKTLELKIKAELKISSLPKYQNNFGQMAIRYREHIAEAHARNDESAARSAAAAFGGLVKRWQGWLIDQITEVVLYEIPMSRELVRKWQSETFNRSLASAKLARYANPKNSGGGRVPALLLSEKATQDAKAIFQANKDRLKRSDHLLLDGRDDAKDHQG